MSPTSNRINTQRRLPVAFRIREPLIIPHPGTAENAGILGIWCARRQWGAGSSRSSGCPGTATLRWYTVTPSAGPGTASGFAGVAELVDARDSKSRGPCDHEGSSPSSGTRSERTGNGATGQFESGPPIRMSGEAPFPIRPGASRLAIETPSRAHARFGEFRLDVVVL